jgi:hypothetical protein
MRIEQIRYTREGSQVLVSARLHWEISRRAPDTIYFQTTSALAHELTPSPEAFLVAALLPTMYFGERRIKLESPICPELREGLDTAMAMFHHWYGERYRPIQIESPTSTDSVLPRTPPRAAVFISGGVDSLSILRSNHLRLPLGHPSRFQAGIIIHGFDIGGSMRGGPEETVFQRALDAVQAVAMDCGITLIPVWTNIRHLCDDHEFWTRVFHSAALSAVGHAFSRRIHQISIASSNAIARIGPWGSHPFLDTCYSSTSLRVLHAGLHHTRLGRVGCLADWPTAVANLRVCGHSPDEQLNCGRCEKCLRTMTQLVAVGKLHETDAFPHKEVSPAMLKRHPILLAFQKAHYQDLIPYLIQRNRNDLVKTIRSKIFLYKLFYRHLERMQLKMRLKRFDQRMFNGFCLERYRRMRAMDKRKLS